MQRNVQIRFNGYSETFVYEIVFWLITLLNIYFVKFIYLVSMLVNVLQWKTNNYNIAPYISWVVHPVAMLKHLPPPMSSYSNTTVNVS